MGDNYRDHISRQFNEELDEIRTRLKYLVEAEDMLCLITCNNIFNGGCGIKLVAHPAGCFASPVDADADFIFDVALQLLN